MAIISWRPRLLERSGSTDHELPSSDVAKLSAWRSIAAEAARRLILSDAR